MDNRQILTNQDIVDSKFIFKYKKKSDMRDALKAVSGASRAVTEHASGVYLKMWLPNGDPDLAAVEESALNADLAAGKCTAIRLSDQAAAMDVELAEVGDEPVR